MRRSLPLVTLILLAGMSLQAKPKKQAAPPAVFGHATYVYVEAQDGDAFTPGLLPEDRQAIFDVEKAIQDWNRYQLTPRRDQAELIFVVRIGRVASAGAHGGFSTGNHSPNGQIGPGNSQGNSIGGGAEVGPPDDLLWVCSRSPDGTQSAPIWTRSEPDGLRSHSVPLLEELRSEVDAAYPMK
jgi:hypothetical protein